MNFADFLPEIATALTNPVLGVAELAAKFVAGRLGLKDSTVEAVTNTLSGMSPDQLGKLKQIDDEFAEHMDDNETKMALAQVDVEKSAASSLDKYVAYGRPTIMWICAAGLAYQLLLFPILSWISLNIHWAVPPALDGPTLTGLTCSLLGLGTMRSFEKYNGVHKEH